MAVNIWYLLDVVLAFHIIQSAVSEVTEDDIDKFIAGIEELRHYSPENRTYDPLKYDEQAAIEGAETYDFIIIGAGAAGSVIASRLSEVSEWRILLLEAGDVESPYGQMPAGYPFLLASKYNWGYTTEPQKNMCLGALDKKCAANAGKAVGGGTAINGMMYTRGLPHDYDLWASQGNADWSYQDVLPYFKKAENCALDKCNNQYYGNGGPLHVEGSRYLEDLSDHFLSAGKELGYEVIDYNGKEQKGFTKSQMTTKHGRRNSAARSYLLPYQNRTNLHVRSLSHVIQIIINPHTKEASGVKYIHKDTLSIAYANKDVVVTAGAANSAQLLMLSGIGPKEDLEKLNIPVVQDLQVGKQLKDHVLLYLPLQLLNINKNKRNNNFRNHIATWLEKGTGPLSGFADALAFLDSGIGEDKNYPDVELALCHIPNINQFSVKNKSQLLDNFYSNMIVIPIHPKSIGTVKLRSKDPLQTPAIDLNQFTDPNDADMQTMINGIKAAINVSHTEAFKRAGIQLDSKPDQYCGSYEYGSDDYWMCVVQIRSVSGSHLTGTCKMGPRSDKFAVVDNELKVYGIKKLRVADSSVIPVSVSGHTHAAVNMVGEKSADLIKKYWKKI